MIADFDGNTLLDIAVSSSGGNGSRFLATSPGSFASMLPELPFGAATHEIVAGDFNHDNHQDIAARGGWIDLVAGSLTESSLTVFFNACPPPPPERR